MKKYGIDIRDAEMTALVMALEFYADLDHYKSKPPGTPLAILQDAGKRARHALTSAGGRGLHIHELYDRMCERINQQKHKLAEQERIIAELKAIPPASEAAEGSGEPRE